MKNWAGWAAAGAVSAALFAGGATAAPRQPATLSEGAAPVAIAMDLSVGMVAAPPVVMASPAAPLPNNPSPPAPTAIAALALPQPAPRRCLRLWQRPIRCPRSKARRQSHPLWKSRFPSSAIVKSRWRNRNRPHRK